MPKKVPAPRVSAPAAPAIDATPQHTATATEPPTEKLPGGVTGKGWRPGQSGNPSGKAKGMAAYAREVTRNGKDLVDFMVRVFRAEEVIQVTRTKREADGTLTPYTVEIQPPLTARMEAADWLANRAFGKPIQAIDASGLPPLAILMRHELSRDPLAEGEVAAQQTVAVVVDAAAMAAVTGAPEEPASARRRQPRKALAPAEAPDELAGFEAARSP